MTIGLKKISKNNLFFLIIFGIFSIAALLVWRLAYGHYILMDPSFEKDIFRPFFRNNLAPFYGVSSSFAVSIKSIVINFLIILTAFYCIDYFVKKRILSAFLLFLFVVFILTQTESTGRFLGSVSHFQTFREDISVFHKAQDVFPEYNQKQMELGVHNAHYPPMYLFLLKQFSIELIKAFHYLLIIPILMLVFKLNQHFRVQRNELYYLVFIPSLVIFPSLDFVLVPAFFFLLIFYLLVQKVRAYEYWIGFVVGSWLLFSFHVFIAGLFFFIYMIFNRKEYFNRTLFLSLLKVFIPLFLTQYLVFLTTDFNVIKCFTDGFTQNNIEMNGNSFDSLERYLLRSTGNVLSFIFGFGPLFGVILYQLFFSQQKKLAASILSTVLILSFGGLYFLEADRVWYIFILPALILLPDFFMTISRLGKFCLLGVSLLYVIYYELLLWQ